jgi:catechol 2,3-dioxygenase-like lactoylglutathione lyase family enzyme
MPQPYLSSSHRCSTAGISALVFVSRATSSNIGLMFEIDALDHVALSVRDVVRSARWYAEVLGFKRLHEDKWNGIPVFIGNGDAAIALFPAAEEIGSAEIGSACADRAAVRTLHFAFRTDRENFARAQDELKKRALPFEFQDHEISHSIYFHDPDGHKIEITTYEL